MLGKFVGAKLSSTSLSSTLAQLPAPSRPKTSPSSRVRDLGLKGVGLALAASLVCLTFQQSPAHAAPFVSTIAVGDFVVNPATGADEEVTDLLSDTDVQTITGAVIFPPQSVGDTFVGSDGETY